MQFVLKSLIILSAILFLANCAGPSAGSAASSSQLTYVSGVGYAFVKPISSTIGVIVSGPATGGLAYLF